MHQPLGSSYSTSASGCTYHWYSGLTSHPLSWSWSARRLPYRVGRSAKLCMNHRADSVHESRGRFEVGWNGGWGRRARRRSEYSWILYLVLIQKKRFSKDQCRAILRLCSYFILVYMYTVNASPTTHWYLYY